MADDIRKTIPQLNAGGVVSGSLFESAQPAQTSTGYASVKVTSDDIATYTNSTKSYSALNTSAKQIIPAINEAASMGGVVQLTQAEYTALTTAEKMNGSIYKITDNAKMYCLDEEYHAVKELTSAQYEALSTAEKNNGTIYIQTDAETTGSDIPVSTGETETIAEAIGSIPETLYGGYQRFTANVQANTTVEIGRKYLPKGTYLILGIADLNDSVNSIFNFTLAGRTARGSGFNGGGVTNFVVWQSTGDTDYFTINGYVSQACEYRAAINWIKLDGLISLT